MTINRYKCEASAVRYCAASTGSGVAMVSGSQDFRPQDGHRVLSQADMLSIS
jgi:hypothetical protein